MVVGEATFTVSDVETDPHDYAGLVINFGGVTVDSPCTLCVRTTFGSEPFAKLEVGKRYKITVEEVP